MKKVLIIILFLVCLGLILYASSSLFGIWNNYHQSEVAYEKIAEDYAVQVTEPGSTEDTTPKEYAPIQVDFAKLKEEGKDIIAWLYCEGTPINYPVVFNGDNDYYLYRLPNGKQNPGGSIFLDERNSGDFSDLNNILYGHNMNDDSMFGSLDEYRNQEYYDAHPVLYLLTPEKDYKIQIIGGYNTISTSDSYAIPYDHIGWQELVDKATQNSKFKTNLSEIPELPLITLSTCSYEYDEARLLIVGAMTELARHEALRNQHH